MSYTGAGDVCRGIRIHYENEFVVGLAYNLRYMSNMPGSEEARLTQILG